MATEPALVLTDEKAAEHGYSGSGPFTFAGVFPGLYVPGSPLALSELGFESQEAADEALEAAGVPLEWTTVAAGEGKAERDNHAPSALEAADERVEEAIEEKAGGTISTHAEADAVAADLGLTFDSNVKTVADKVAAIEAKRSDPDLPLEPPAGGE